MDSRYLISEVVASSSRAVIYRGVRALDGKPVLLKVLAPQHRPQHLAWLKNEHEIGLLLDTPAVVRPLALESYEGRPALVMEDFGGESLDRRLGAPMEPGAFLDLALRITAALVDIHQRNVIHKDLKPENILIHPVTGELKLIDFGIAAQLPCPQPGDPGRRIEGSLPYMSPEQTGRMNRAPDPRSDLYSLGITLYQVLTGRLPFQATDPLEWVHCHIARSPLPPREIAPAVPQLVSDLILKLLAKEAEDRYQTARGLRHDLQRCQEQWRARGRIDPFPLGTRDVPDRFRIPQRFYGRDAEITALRSAFERVVASGAPELVLVSGYAGSGKSSLVHELQRSIVRARGFFASGKFDPLQRDIPYATIAEALSGLVRELLAESEDQVAAWKERLAAALGASGQLIVDVIPAVELLLGSQPVVPSLPPLDAQNRFQRAFRRFLGVLAQKEHPLALFLDDLQWADSASLGLLEDLITHPETRHLLVIGAYRDNEVQPEHPLGPVLDQVRKSARVVDIVLGPLSQEHLTTLLCDTLRTSRGEVAQVAQLLEDKTGGNPFFVIQFLTALHEEHLLVFDEGAAAWRWDLAKICAKGFTDNVVDLMVGKLVRLPARTQQALKRLACMGSSADLALLLSVSGLSEEELHADLLAAVRAGLILRQESAYKFLHDRIQEAVYTQIPEAERTAVHLTIGRLLLARTPPAERDEKLFEIVSQFNRGAALIGSQEERERVAELDRAAGERAMRSTAYAPAQSYLAAGAALLSEDRWQRGYELAFALELDQAQCEFLTGEFSAAELRLSELGRRTRELPHIAAVTCLLADLYTAQLQHERAKEVCLGYLQRIEVRWTPHPTDEELRQEYGRIWQQLGRRAIEELVDLPAMTEPRWQATMDVLMKLHTAACFSDEKLLCLAICRMVNISLEHGSCDASAVAYTGLGQILSAGGPFSGDHRAGVRFGDLGLQLLHKRRQVRFRARLYAAVGMAIIPWSRPLRSGLEFIRRGFDTAIETGDLLVACATTNARITLLLALGEPLAEVQQAAERAFAFVRDAKFELFVAVNRGLQRLIRALRGPSSAPSLDEAERDEARFEAHLVSAPELIMARCWYWIRKLQVQYFAGDYASALTAAAGVEPILWTTGFVFERAEYHFYRALALAAQSDTSPVDEQQVVHEALGAHLRQLEIWADSCPRNFRDRAALVAAEIARLRGDNDEAAQLYEQAIRAARDNGFVPSEAIAYETAARFYRARGFELIADTYLRAARDRYLRWGADGKVQQIERLHPELIEPRPLTTTTLAVGSEQLDVLSVIKASQAISGEIVLDDLLRRLTEVVLQQAGAQKGCLLLVREGGLVLVAEALVDEKGATAVKLLRPQPAVSSSLLPASIVSYVARTRQKVLLPNAAQAPSFATDEYIARTRPRSVLCLPILKQAELVGLLYLENNLVAGAFTVEQLAVLELLAAQAAISLESALLLAHEQAARTAAEETARRTAFLAEAGELLGESLDYEQILARLATLSVRSFADAFLIDIVEGGELKRIAATHSDPAKQALLVELAQRFPPQLSSPQVMAQVIRTGKPMLLDLSEIERRTVSLGPDAPALIRALGMRTALSVPLIARGRCIGAILFGSGKPGQRYGRADLDLARELARRVAIAIDNARLHRQALEALRVREEFLSVASHELRTPMTALLLALQALREADPAMHSAMHPVVHPATPLGPAAARRLVEISLAQGQRLNRLIDELLEDSRIQMNKLRLERAEVDLVAVVREVVQRFELSLVRSRCQVTVHEAGPVVGRWDRSRVDQVVTNLLSNAIKFGAGQPIELHVERDTGLARLRVRDQGIGIDPEQTARIFERFERGVSSRHYGGLGLGLYISRSIVTAHGGTLQVTSQPGAGATFTVELPCESPREGP